MNFKELNKLISEKRAGLRQLVTIEEQKIRELTIQEAKNVKLIDIIESFDISLTEFHKHAHHDKDLRIVNSDYEVHVEDSRNFKSGSPVRIEGTEYNIYVDRGNLTFYMPRYVVANTFQGSKVQEFYDKLFVVLKYVIEQEPDLPF